MPTMSDQETTWEIVRGSRLTPRLLDDEEKVRLLLEKAYHEMVEHIFLGGDYGPKVTHRLLSENKDPLTSVGYVFRVSADPSENTALQQAAVKKIEMPLIKAADGQASVGIHCFEDNKSDQQGMAVLLRGLLYAEAYRRIGRPVVIHCQQGVDRSATVVTLLLALAFDLPMPIARAYTKNVRFNTTLQQDECQPYLERLCSDPNLPPSQNHEGYRIKDFLKYVLALQAEMSMAADDQGVLRANWLEDKISDRVEQLVNDFIADEFKKDRTPGEIKLVELPVITEEERRADDPRLRGAAVGSRAVQTRPLQPEVNEEINHRRSGRLAVASPIIIGAVCGGILGLAVMAVVLATSTVIPPLPVVITLAFIGAGVGAAVAPKAASLFGGRATRMAQSQEVLLEPVSYLRGGEPG